MEVSNEIKEEIRKTQTDLKNAIRVHQIWVARLREDVNNVHFKSKVIQAEKDIIDIGQNQKLVLERLRRELELYQQRLKTRNKQIDIEIDNQLIAQQIRDHQLKYRSKNRTLLKPCVLTEIHIKTENDDLKENISDLENDIKLNGKENHKDGFLRTFSQLPNALQDTRNNFANALTKVKEALSAANEPAEWRDPRSDSEYSHEPSPSPSPPPLPQPGETITKEIFLRLIGLITPAQKESVEKKRNERRKRAVNNPARNEFLYGNFEMLPKRKKYNQFPYLQQSNDPPQTRSAKLRKQQNQNKSSREGSPSGSSTENKAWSSNKPAWAASLPASLTVEPIYPTSKKSCQVCGRNDVPSLLAYCGECGVWQHTACAAGCAHCRAPLCEPPRHQHTPTHSYSDVPSLLAYCGECGVWQHTACAAGCAHCRAPLCEPPRHQHTPTHSYSDKLAERKSLQERNIKLCVELRKLETRAATLKASLDDHNAEKRQLLTEQIQTQRNLQKLLDFISQFKETSVSVRSPSVSESGSELSKSNEE